MVGAIVVAVLTVIGSIVISQAAFENHCLNDGGYITVASEMNDVIHDPLDRVCVVHGKVAFHETTTDKLRSSLLAQEGLSSRPVSQQNAPMSGDHTSLNGGVVSSTWKQMLMGPNVCPWLNSCRVNVLQSAPLVVICDVRLPWSTSARSSGAACVEELEFLNITVMWTSLPSIRTFETHSV